MVGWKFRLPRGDKKWVVYGDLNCPFCFALEERLVARDVDAEVEWRLIEHATDLPFNGGFATPAQLEQLGVEIETLRERAPDVDVQLPAFRSNSRRAIEAVAEASLFDSTKADALRRALFLALWRDSRDIANVELLQALAKDAGLPVLKGTHRAREERLRWTNEWRAGGFNRIPVLVAGRSAILEGLPTPRRLDVFLRTGLFSSTTDAACEEPDPDERETLD